MGYISDITKILKELKKGNKKKEVIEERPIVEKETNEVELLGLRIKELENEVLRNKKYIQKKSKLEEVSTINKIIKEKENIIYELKQQVLNLQAFIIEKESENGRMIEIHKKDLKEIQVGTSDLIKRYENELSAQKEKSTRKLESLQSIIQENENKQRNIIQSEEEKYKEIHKMYEKEKNELKKEFKIEIENKLNELKEIEIKHEKDKEVMKENQMNELKEIEINYEKRKEELKNEINTLSNTIRERKEMEKRLNDEIIDLKKEVENKKQLEREIENHKEKEKNYKRKLLDFQNNIQVFLRLKPKQKENRILFEKQSDLLSPKYLLNGNMIITENDTKKNTFQFDRIFEPKSTQSEIFDEIESIIYGFIEGYNICIFAYGQTGSGKTFTMLGDEKERGLIPRAISYIYNEIEGMDYSLELTILEIYNEKVTNLITNELLKNTEQENGERIHSEEEILNHIRNSIKMRRTESTDCNEFSSRSHSVYSLKLTIKKENERIESILNFIDLAGSERIKESHVEGDRLKETQNINMSLLNLKIVFNSIINREKHVPYRDSKLTYLLRNSLINKSKIIMLLNASIEAKDFNETLCSLRFGQIVNDVYVGRGVKQIKKVIE